jgi:hypothetical protein
MKGSRFAVAGCAVALLAVSLGAQQTSRTSRPLTNAQLQARVHALEEENAGLKRNHDLLLKSCGRNADDDLFSVEDFRYGVTETTSTYLRFGWKATVHNGLNRNEDFAVTVQFLNKDDLVIGSTRLIGQAIRAFDEQTVSGDAMIGVPAAYNVASAKVTVNRYP